MKLRARDGQTVIDPHTGLPVDGIVDTDAAPTTAARLSLLRLHHQGDLIEVVEVPPKKSAGGDK
ncbi:hypothetical protein ACW73L_07480 [Methylolobus aquaticus]